MVTGLLDGNRKFVNEIFDKDKKFFFKLAEEQRPTVLWIGCSDSRVPVNMIADQAWRNLRASQCRERGSHK